MNNLKDELINQILLIDKNMDMLSYKQYLHMVFAKYDIQSSKKELSIYEGDINESVIKKFVISKTVKGCTERTLEKYVYYIKTFSEYIGKPLTEVTADDIRIYMAEKAIKDKISRSSQICIYRALSTFYVWALNDEIIQKNPIIKVECPKKEKKIKKAFTEYEVETLRNNVLSPMETALLETMMSTWCRVTELSNMNVTDINEDGSIEIFGKGQKTRRVYLNTRSRIAINEYLKERNGTNIALFTGRNGQRMSAPSIEKLCRKWGKTNGIEDCHPHRFRRTGATFALRAGMPIQDVARLLGHESIDTTQIYLDIDEKEIERSHGKYVK